MHLTVISYPSALCTVFETAALRADGFSHQADHSFARCQRPAQLVQCVANVAAIYGNINLLDLFGHGRPGGFTLGDDHLEPGAMTLEEALQQVAGFLRPEANVRLLGCDTGLGEAGLAMLRRVSALLGGRTVWGTVEPITGYDFGPDGFSDEVAKAVLVSSKDLTLRAAAHR